MSIIRTIYVSVIVAMIGISCSNWLDIEPKDTATENVVFKNFSGYRTLLNGIYQELSDYDLYGKEMTWGFVSALGQYYNNYNASRSLPYTYTEEYDYSTSEVQNYATGIWNKGYNVIANCNDLIQHMEKVDKNIFPTSEYGEADMIEGEAYAIRAMMHFDILRLFADSPIAHSGANGVPYSEVYPDKVPQRKSVAEVLEHVIKDLQKAEELLKQIDTQYFTSWDISNRYGHNGNDIFMTCRGSHINYYAVRALLARVFLYKGDYSQAKEYALNLYNEIQNSGDFNYSTGINQSNIENRNRLMMEDVVFALYNENLSKHFEENYLTNYTSNSGSDLVVALNVKNTQYMYETYRNDADDYRYRFLIFTPSGISTDYKASLKYLASSVSAYEPYNNYIPVFRKSELEYILAECYAKESDFDNAITHLKNVRTARGAVSRNASITSTGMTFDSFMEELEYEVWKENLGEGQFFFWCKRIGKTSMRNGLQRIDMTGKWTLNIPDSETTL